MIIKAFKNKIQICFPKKGYKWARVIAEFEITLKTGEPDQRPEPPVPKRLICSPGVKSRFDINKTMSKIL